MPFMIVTIREAQGQNPTCSSRIRLPRLHRLLPKRQNSMSPTCLPRPRDRALPLAQLRSERNLSHPEVLARILHFPLVSNKTHHPCGSSCNHHASEQRQFCRGTTATKKAGMTKKTILTFSLRNVMIQSRRRPLHLQRLPLFRGRATLVCRHRNP